jgi:NAD(P)-dependent dehydrogenase (short-subunit alcohol dehydrogenase family)
MGALDGKVIVVIGGTTGLGFSAAMAFLREGAAGIVVTGRNADNCAAAQAALGNRSLAVAGDAAAPSSAEAAIDAAQGRFGGFHGLYHVAGGSGRKHGDGPLHEITDEGWHRTLEWNLTSVMHSNRAAVRTFLRQGGGGAILNTGSVLGWSPSPAHFSTHAYAAAKAAIIGLTKAAAAAYAPHDIRCNVLAPALVDTPMARRAAGDSAILHFLRTKQPLDGGRMGQPGDLDAAAVFFLSDGARYTTGQVLAVDGGWTVSEGQHSPGTHPEDEP